MLFCCKSAWRASRWRWLSIFFTSSRTRKFSAWFTTPCGNPDTLKAMSISSSCVNKPMDCPLSKGLSVLVWPASTVSSASLSLSTGSTDTGTQLWLNDDAFTVLEFVFSRPNKTSFPISWVNEPDGCSLTGLPVLDNWVFWFWLDSLDVFAASSNFWIQFFHPIIFEGNLWRRSRWRIYFLENDFSRFHQNNFRDTISWECVVKDDCVPSCLIELQSLVNYTSRASIVIWPLRLVRTWLGITVAASMTFTVKDTCRASIVVWHHRQGITIGDSNTFTVNYTRVRHHYQGIEHLHSKRHLKGFNRRLPPPLGGNLA